MIIGLTGGSGTGKSTVSGFFEDKGFLIIDADNVYKNICLPGSQCLGEIVDFFGKEVLSQDMSLNRKALADIVFFDSQKKEKLNLITHKFVIKEIEEIIKNNKGKNIVIDAPLLIEAGLDGICTFTVCVLADKDVRIERIMQRDLKTYDEAKARVESQNDDEFYLDRCDIALYNNGDLDIVISALEKELEKYV